MSQGGGQFPGRPPSRNIRGPSTARLFSPTPAIADHRRPALHASRAASSSFLDCCCGGRPHNCALGPPPAEGTPCSKRRFPPPPVLHLLTHHASKSRHVFSSSGRRPLHPCLMQVGEHACTCTRVYTTGSRSIDRDLQISSCRDLCSRQTWSRSNCSPGVVRARRQSTRGSRGSA